MYTLTDQFLGVIEDRAITALLRALENYVNGTTIQFERIQSSKASLLAGKRVMVRSILTLFLDVHFYFVCYDKAQNLFKEISERVGDEEIISFWAEHESNFKSFNDARNHLEHIETRATAKYLNDFGNLKNDTFTFGGEEFDVSREGLDYLTEAFQIFVDILALIYLKIGNKQR